MVIVDTTVWIDYLRGMTTRQVDWLEQALDQQPLGILDLILCELLQGAPTEKQARALQAELEQLVLFETGGRYLAIETAKNYRYLRSKGFTIRKTMDCYIATFCILRNHTLLHNDRDFEPFEQELGLEVVHP